ncbi:hypothetical protein GV827_21615 [Sulfitobacter sp. JBTF-M27]|uniref:Uncharacterized protein n=1 Tax=Sulfitobacter sediminilitoris TaxID=2698830 RepID=A0A6P0CFJ5_9RHOB|nr:hypothetical protein [Sulfitobacter sediminilitoris]NEK24971.1 hypothetical protein [Sulfitobacter sediminilitoris]
MPQWRGIRAPLEIPPGRLLAPRLPLDAEPLITIPGLDEVERALGFRRGAQTWLSELTMLAKDSRGVALVTVDPDQIVAAFTGDGPRAVPDLAMFQGLRIALAILLTDGWRLRAPASGRSSLGQPAYALAKAIFGETSAPVSFGWPDATTDKIGSDADATDAGHALATLPHVSALPAYNIAGGISLGSPPLLRLSHPSFGGPKATPRAGSSAISELVGPPGFADPTGLHARAAAVARSDTPWPSSPDVLVIRARDLLDMSGQLAAMRALELHASDARAAMKIERYAGWLEGALSAQIVPEGPYAWRVQNRGALNTLRIDRAEGWVIDMSRSTGILGTSRYGPTLFVALDPASSAPFLALRSTTAAVTADPAFVEVVEAGPELSNVNREGCQTVFTAEGRGQIKFRSSAKPAVKLGRLSLEVVPTESDLWHVSLPTRAASETLSIAVGCP